jgi:hypothetical protein
MKVRRIVTGYIAAGKAVVKTDEQLTAVPRIGAGIKGCEIWSTDEMPVDNSAAADAAQRAGLGAEAPANMVAWPISSRMVPLRLHRAMESSALPRFCACGSSDARACISRVQRLSDNDAEYVAPADMLAELREDPRERASPT